MPTPLAKLYLLLSKNKRFEISIIAFFFLIYNLKSSFVDLDVKYVWVKFQLNQF